MMVRPDRAVALAVTVAMLGSLGAVAPVGTASAQATCRGKAATIEGTPGDDVLVGTPGPDVIVGHDGDDEIYGLGGDDELCGGAGHDTIEGGDGEDWLLGQQGRDVLDGGPGDDTIHGGAHADDIVGGAGDDGVLGGDGPDSIEGGSGADLLCGDAANDAIHGGGGPDRIGGGGGRDWLAGQSGPDIISGDRPGTWCPASGRDAADRIIGGAGDDTLAGRRGHDAIYGGKGRDTIRGHEGDDLIDGGPSTDDCAQGPGKGRLRRCERADLKVRVLCPASVAESEVFSCRIRVTNRGPHGTPYWLSLGRSRGMVDCRAIGGDTEQAHLGPRRTRTHRITTWCVLPGEPAALVSEAVTFTAAVDAHARDPRRGNDRHADTVTITEAP